MDDLTRARLSARTLVAQGIGIHEPVTKGIVPPIHMSTTYLRDADNGYRAGHVYGHTDNVSVQQAEQLIAALEGAEQALLFGSGMAAATSVILGLDKPTHIVASQVMYWGFRSWLRDVGRYGHRVTFVETSDLDAVRAAVVPGQTGLLWIETPSNPMWTVTDIAAVAEIAHAADAILCVDSTVSTPILTRPLALGADIVMHSATKYLNGHSDVIAGVLGCARETALWRRIAKNRGQLGQALSPFDAWLLTRGMRTLDVRVRAQAKSAAILAERLQSHPAVSQVLYPGLPTHPGHDVAMRQMSGGFGGMLSMRVAKGEKAAIAVAASVELWKRATSLGGVESLIEHRASIEGKGSPCPVDLLRLSVGLEDVDELHFDLTRALTMAV
ncbi:MAG: PLP-dependent transferase [Proteobacteria bacterium]|nr:PLP-dependent transferase [Pseudomonadota bacterium]